MSSWSRPCVYYEGVFLRRKPSKMFYVCLVEYEKQPFKINKRRRRKEVKKGMGEGGVGSTSKETRSGDHHSVVNLPIRGDGGTQAPESHRYNTYKRDPARKTSPSLYALGASFIGVSSHAPLMDRAFPHLQNFHNHCAWRNFMNPMSIQEILIH